jgi:hypothetical protein
MTTVKLNWCLVKDNKQGSRWLTPLIMQRSEGSRFEEKEKDNKKVRVTKTLKIKYASLKASLVTYRKAHFSRTRTENARSPGLVVNHQSSPPSRKVNSPREVILMSGP